MGKKVGEIGRKHGVAAASGVIASGSFISPDGASIDRTNLVHAQEEDGNARRLREEDREDRGTHRRHAQGFVRTRNLQHPQPLHAA